ncbi:type II toxin-antitoxin system VapC family toxin [Rhizobium sp. C4]|uniref:type II toxin-antitoxin system VapC family toxin n=1 Tax=Rhizobium sp. C4 TaxID=1349800 RepID=UPI001E6329D9|nr:type II toxin-antitoxin system VapC family toxin [Rhizobium sp. C4]MCD2174328.1 type II toxin-antitoxin system VapC family toxin [Rhizobium sp. C4]
MNVLLDTNVLSEPMRARPNSRALLWLHELDEDRAFMSVVTLAEIRRGVPLLDPGRRWQALSDWLEHDLPERFEGRLLQIDAAIALAWGDVMAGAKRAGRGLSSMDGLLAATALAHDLTLATRNIKDFEGLGIRLIDPWLT